MVIRWIGDCLRTGNQTKVKSAFNDPSRVGKSSSDLFGWGYGGAGLILSSGREGNEKR